MLMGVNVVVLGFIISPMLSVGRFTVFLRHGGCKITPQTMVCLVLFVLRLVKRAQTKRVKTMIDPIEAVRRKMIESGKPDCDLQVTTKRWDTRELQAEFEVISFLAPFVRVVRKSDGKSGVMEFTYSPRFYFNFVEDVKREELK
jgi:hypothetical protein